MRFSFAPPIRNLGIRNKLTNIESLYFEKYFFELFKQLKMSDSPEKTLQNEMSLINKMDINKAELYMSLRVLTYYLYGKKHKKKTSVFIFYYLMCTSFIYN